MNLPGVALPGNFQYFTGYFWHIHTGKRSAVGQTAVILSDWF